MNLFHIFEIQFKIKAFTIRQPIQTKTMKMNPNLKKKVQNHENESKLEEKSLYKCHYCKQKIDRNDIEIHLMIFHKIIISENENICEICDIFFDVSNDLLDHIQTVHEGENPNEPEELESLEDGKSKFLKFIANFKSQKDARNFLYWIKFNDANLFLTTKQEIENESSIRTGNFSNVKEKALEEVEILDEDITNSFAQIFQDDFNEEEYQEEIEENSEFSPLDSENEESVEKNIVMCNECHNFFVGRKNLMTHIRSVHMREPCGKAIQKARKQNHPIHSDKEGKKKDRAGNRTYAIFEFFG